MNLLRNITEYYNIDRNLNLFVSGMKGFLGVFIIVADHLDMADVPLRHQFTSYFTSTSKPSNKLSTVIEILKILDTESDHQPSPHQFTSHLTSTTEPSNNSSHFTSTSKLSNKLSTVTEIFENT